MVPTGNIMHSQTKFPGFLRRRKAVVSEVKRYLAEIDQKPLTSFQLAYKKHTLSLEDLSTLTDENWLNDQVGAKSGWKLKSVSAKKK